MSSDKLIYDEINARIFKIEDTLNKIILKLDKLENKDTDFKNSIISLKENTTNIIATLPKEEEYKPTIGFILLRHVNSPQTNIYWQECYDGIRKFYPENDILIIDDNSNYEYITNKDLYKVKIIKSEYHGRGELLPYYYYLSNKLFDIAFIIHDSVFIQKHLDLHVDKYSFTWDFRHGGHDDEDVIRMIKLFNDENLLNFHQNKNLWVGCFGAMTTITHDFLTQIDKKYNLSILLDVILTRYNRCSFERVIACILQIEAPQTTRLGNIHKYMPWATTYEEGKIYKKHPLVKVWTGR
jgi:hypothetical protein